MCEHVWIIQSLSTTLCATYNMLRLIPWVKSCPVAKLLLKKKNPTTKPPPPPAMNKKPQTKPTTKTPQTSQAPLQ